MQPTPGVVSGVAERAAVRGGAERSPAGGAHGVAVAELEGVRWCCSPPVCAPTSSTAPEMCLAASFTPTVVAEVADVVHGIALVATGGGLGFVPRSATNLHLPGVVYRPLYDTPPPPSTSAACTATTTAHRCSPGCCRRCGTRRRPSATGRAGDATLPRAGGPMSPAAPCRVPGAPMTDAIVIGSGPNGLVAANVLADAGWSVVVIEAAPTLGGAVQTAELTAPGFRNDVFSAFYPLAAASPALTALRLERHGLRWAHAPAVVAHPRPDGPAAVMHRDAASTAAALDVDARGDGRAYTEVVEHWRRVADPFLDCILRPFPPLTPAARLVARTRVRGTLDLARLALVPLRRFVEERFDGESARLLFAGNALHADLTPETAGSTLFGWLLVGLGQQHGFPVPVGGAGSLAGALVRGPNRSACAS
ncbi:MAG: LysR substrate-binding domain-containing protein [Ilumatobacteraceae bacterium]